MIFTESALRPIQSISCNVRLCVFKDASSVPSFGDQIQEGWRFLFKEYIVKKFNTRTIFCNVSRVFLVLDIFLIFFGSVLANQPIVQCTVKHVEPLN